jgi:Protein of unknown function (DUF998)
MKPADRAGLRHWWVAVPLAAAMAMSRTCPGAHVRIVSVTLLSIGLACVSVLHVLRDDLSPISHRISEYATGRYGVVMTVAFMSVGEGLFAFAWSLWRSRSDGRESLLVPLAVAVAGVGMIVAGVYPIDRDGVESTSELIHNRATATAAVSLIGTAVTLSIVRPARMRQPWQPVPAALAVAATVFGALNPLLHHSSWSGLSQRALWLTLLAWLLVAAWRIQGGSPPHERRQVPRRGRKAPTVAARQGRPA